MAQIDDLKVALIKADAAGNAGDARVIAAKIRQLMSAGDSQKQNPPNFAENMPAGQRFRAGIAAGALDAGEAMLNTLNDATKWIVENVPGARVVDQMGNDIGISSIDRAAPVDEKRRAERQDQNKPLLDTTAGRAGSVVGTAAALAPTALIPGANTYLGSAAIGAGAGAALSGSGERSGGAVIGAAGGLAGKYLGDKLSDVVRFSVGKIKTAVGAGKDVNVAAREAINEALAPNKLSLESLPEQAQADLLAEVRKALEVGDQVDPAAISRKADFAAIGAKPTTGQITRDPQQFAFENTLAGINGAGKDLADAASENNKALIGTLNAAGAAKAPGELGAGKAVSSSMGDFADKAKKEIGGLYDAAKAAGGRDVPLSPADFSTRAGQLLDAELKNAFLPGDVRGMLNDFAEGKVPLTVATAEQFKTILATAQRGAQDGNVKQALGLVRQALDETQPEQDVGKEAIAAFNKARAANRKFAGRVESMPALKATLDGAEPDKIFQKYIVGGSVGDVRRAAVILKQTPEKHAAVKAQVVDMLKQKALNGASDEVGNFSQSAYNKALSQFGVKKLEALGFSQEEINTLQTVGRVSSYIQTAPAGAKVNRSNTAAQGYNLLMGLLTRISKIPVLGPLSAGEKLAEGVGGMAARSALKAPIPTQRTPSAADVTGRMGTVLGASTALEMFRPGR